MLSRCCSDTSEVPRAGVGVRSKQPARTRVGGLAASSPKLSPRHNLPPPGSIFGRAPSRVTSPAPTARLRGEHGVDSYWYGSIDHHTKNRSSVAQGACRHVPRTRASPEAAVSTAAMSAIRSVTVNADTGNCAPTASREVIVAGAVHPWGLTSRRQMPGISSPWSKRRRRPYERVTPEQRPSQKGHKPLDANCLYGLRRVCEGPYEIRLVAA